MTLLSLRKSRLDDEPGSMRKVQLKESPKQQQHEQQQQKSAAPKKGLFGRFKTSTKTRTNKPKNPVAHGSAGGAFHCALTRSDPSSRLLVLSPDDDADEEDALGPIRPSVSGDSSATSLTTSLASISTTSSAVSSTPAPKQKWRSSGFDKFHNHSRLLVKPHSRSSEPVNLGEVMEYDEESELEEVMERSKRLPDTFCYANNIIMVNNERVKNGVAPLIRRSELDQVARQQAKRMVKSETVEHSEPDTLREAISAAFAASKNPDAASFSFCRRLGENAAAGPSIRIIHFRMRLNVADKNNMLDRRYTHMGMGTARGPDDRLYMCQIFKG